MTKRSGLIFFMSGQENEPRPLWDDMITVGRIIRPHGHRGEVAVVAESDFAADRFRPGAVLQWLRGGELAPVQVEASRQHQGRWLLTLGGVASMNDAETLRGLELRIPAEALQPLEAGAHYIHDLQQCEVVTMSGDRIGRVIRVQFGSGAPLLVVQKDAGAELLVPMVEGILRSVDVAGKRVVIDPPAGLLELNG